MVVNRATREVVHARFSDLPRWLRAGDTLFRNNAAVLPARLHAWRPTGGAVECFLLRPDPARGEGENGISGGVGEGRGAGDVWWCLVRPGKKLPVGATFAHGREFCGMVLEKDGEGAALVRFTMPGGGGSITEIANRLGDVPLPPYIARGGDAEGRAEERARDIERYQTVYADRTRQVAVAAPTAGLHFTPELLAQLAGQGVGTADITLHVGLGTFKPIATATIEEHPIHREIYEIPPATQRALLAPAGRRIAVGTTTVRTVEDFLARRAAVPVTERAGEGTGAEERAGGGGGGLAYIAEAGIYIYPPRTFRGVDALVTNFHQPRSTLMCLVSAFLTPGSTDGIAWLRELYAEAIAREYRFFSYGDAMLIL